MADSQAHSRCGELRCRSSIQTDRVLHRMDTKPTSLQDHMQETLPTRCGSVCLPPKLPAPKVCIAVSRPRIICSGRLSAGMVAVDLVHQPTNSGSPFIWQYGRNQGTIPIRWSSRGSCVNLAILMVRCDTETIYTGRWRAWAQWCAERDTCPISAPVTEVLQF